MKVFRNILIFFLFFLSISVQNSFSQSGNNEKIKDYNPLIQVALSPPTLSSPTNGAINQPINNLVLSWSAVPNALTYKLHLSTDPYFSDTVYIYVPNQSDTYRIVNGLGYNTVYYWKVRSENRTDTSAYSQYWSFRTAPTLFAMAPTLTYPANNDTNIPTTITLRWNPLIGAESYRVLIAKDAAFTISPDSTTVSGTSLLINKDTSTWYYWKVKAINAVSVSNYSTAWRFKTYSGLPVSVVLPDTIVMPDSSVGIPISVNSLTNKNITSFQFALTFDKNVLKIDSVSRSTTLCDTMSLFILKIDTITSTVARLTVSHATPKPMSGSGTLLKIYFKAVGKQFDESELKFTSFIFNAGSPPASTMNGRIRIDAFRCGDANLDAKINTVDAAAILRHIVGDTVLGAISIRNGDVDKNGILAAYDASLILRYYINLSLPLGTCLTGTYLKSIAGYTQINEQPSFYFDNIRNSSLKIIKIGGIFPQNNIYALSFNITLPKTTLTRSDFEISYSNTNYLNAVNITDGKIKIAIINPFGINSDDISIKINLGDDYKEGRISITDIICNNTHYSDQSLTNIKEIEEIRNYNLIGAFPNPFNPVTKIVFQTPEVANIRLDIFDVQGRLIRTILNERLEPGVHNTIWDGKDNYNVIVSSGQYYCRMCSERYNKTIPVLLIR